MNGFSNEHLSAEALQALLEGEGSRVERARAEEHLAFCSHCSAELDAWRALLEDLDDLPALAPASGFADRVVAGVRAGEPIPVAARVPGTHLDAAILQDYLDGSLGTRRRARVEAHLAACGGCSDEADAWATLFARMGDLPRFAPGEGFRRRVLTAVDAAPRPFLAARLRARWAAVTQAHPDAGRLQDLLEGALPAWRVARMRAHVSSCDPCSADLEGWRSLLTSLDALPRYTPEAAFADRVMARVRLPGRVATAAASPVPVWGRALARVRSFVPRTRRAWAAISGVAVTPAVVSALVLYAVFSHPTVTAGSLASFAWWQVADVASAGWGAASAMALESVELFGVYSLFEALASAPWVVAGGALAYSLVSLVAIRVLYKNILVNRTAGGRYAYVSTT